MTVRVNRPLRYTSPCNWNSISRSHNEQFLSHFFITLYPGSSVIANVPAVESEFESMQWEQFLYSTMWTSGSESVSGNVNKPLMLYLLLYL